MKGADYDKPQHFLATSPSPEENVFIEQLVQEREQSLASRQTHKMPEDDH